MIDIEVVLLELENCLSQYLRATNYINKSRAALVANQVLIRLELELDVKLSDDQRKEIFEYQEIFREITHELAQLDPEKISWFKTKALESDRDKEKNETNIYPPQESIL